MNLKTKIIIFVLCISVIPIFVIGKMSYFLGIDSTIKYKKEFTVNMIRTIQDQIQQEIDGVYDDLDYVASQLINQEEEKLIGIIKTVKETNKKYNKVYFVKDTIYFSIPVSRENIILRDQPWYNIAKSRGISVSNPHPTKPLLTITKAIKDNKGNMIGMVGIEYNLEKILKKITDIKIGETGYLQIVDKNGIPVLYPVGSDISISMYVKNKILEEKNGMIDYKWNKEDKFIVH